MNPKLRACTNINLQSTHEKHTRHDPKALLRSQVVKTCQWTPDGSSLITTGGDNTLRVLTPSPDILDGEETKGIQEYSKIAFPSSVVGSAVHPNFRLQEYAQAMVAVSTSDHPIQLFNIHNHTDLSATSSYRKVVASYPLPNPNTEIFEPSHALAFPDASTLLAGTTRQRGRVALFDLSRPGERPVTNVQLKEKARPIVSALAPMSDDGSDQEGAWRNIAAVGYYAAGSALVTALYDFRSRQVTSSFKLDGKGPNASPGVTQLLWSPNKRFIYVIQRQSSDIPVLDVRMDLEQVATLSNYKGLTNQRLSAAVVNHSSSPYLLTGSTDGTMCMYGDEAFMGMDCDVAKSWSAYSSHFHVSSVAPNPLTESAEQVVIASAGSLSHTSNNTQGLEDESQIKIWSL